VSLPEVVLVARFHEPPEFMLCGWPKHKIEYGLTGHGIRPDTELPRMNPLRANSSHKLDFTEEHLKEIESKVADLRRLATELRGIKNCCPGKRLIANCRILEALSDNVPRSRLRTD
jgi:hypothetical protein